MPNRSKRNNDPKKRPDPMIVVALIGLAGTIVAALLASPLVERWFSQRPTITETAIALPSITSTTSSQTSSLQTAGNSIGLNQTITGQLYHAEPGTWIFSEGPATVTIVLDMSPYGAALIILLDPSGVQREYVEQQNPGIARLVNYTIPTTGDYKILVRNLANMPVDYTLTVQDALTPPPP